MLYIEGYARGNTAALYVRTVVFSAGRSLVHPSTKDSPHSCTALRLKLVWWPKFEASTFGQKAFDLGLVAPWFTRRQRTACTAASETRLVAKVRSLLSGRSHSTSVSSLLGSPLDKGQPAQLHCFAFETRWVAKFEASTFGQKPFDLGLVAGIANLRCRRK